MFELKSKNIGMIDKNSNDKFSSFFEIEQVPNSRGLYEFVRWIDEGGIELSPDFQRGYVWTKQKASALIESFLMNIPVPSIFMYMQDDKRHIIDGKQRLETIRRFFKNEWIENGVKTEFALDFEDMDNPRQGYTFKQIMEDIDKSGDKKRLSDVYLNAITIRATSTDENKRMDSIYYIFERLNTGGVSLTPSEIRLSIWNQMQLLKDIKDLSNNDTWVKSIKTSKKKANENKSYPAHERSEILLKIVALANNYNEYTSPMKDFLTAFLRKERKQQTNFDAQIIHLKSIIEDLNIQTFLKPYLAKKNIIIETLYTAVLIAKNRNITYNIPSPNIFEDTSFTKQGGTAQKSVVIKRIKIVYEAITGTEL